MGQQTTTIAAVRFYRQPTKPPDAADGATWVTDSDGAGDDTTGRYIYNADADRWELDSAVGPSEPTAGTPVTGALWRDTSDGSGKQYDGTAFVTLSPNQTQSGTAAELVKIDESGQFTVPANGSATTTIGPYGPDYPVRFESFQSGTSTSSVEPNTNGTIDVVVESSSNFDKDTRIYVYAAQTGTHTHPL